ncbi:two pore calcium channel protein 1-like isoform X1 [Mya arenaria]|uniref:two pore calcium channel protein 1-like isoform X1 n=1 Tax=Mya arenaria TaxID=6604 RepID=UPI0022E604CD|nr:two pore calcium channel protein 1-like isoform X1 [Mya arenaria]
MAGNADDSQLLSEVNADLPDVYDLNDGSQELVIGGGNLVLQVVDDIPAERLSKNWKLNHLEAAIYLQEGENNDKFYTHPKGHEALPAYQIAHNKWFHLLDFAASICVLLLAACERPAVDLIKLPVGVHGSLEILMLLVLSLELAIRMKWLSWRVYFRHPRTVIKTVMLIIMLVEAVTVIVRQHNHFRVTRAIRPIFLLNTYYGRGIRRIARQVLQSLPPIFDMLVLLIFIMLVFSVLGFYLFSTVPNNPYFATLKASFISLFILLTTANYPDVMMPAYNNSRYSALFFIVYLAIELYFIMNLFLAVVYDTFSGFDKKKLKKLLLHKREGCRKAFKLLVIKQDQNEINLRSFLAFLVHFRPKLSRRDGYMLFKALNKKKNGKLSIDEFYHVYDFVDCTWKEKSLHDELWSSNFSDPCRIYFEKLYAFVTWKWFDYFIYLMIFANFVSMIVETVQINMQGKIVGQHSFTLSSISIAFVCLYCVEAMMKILGKGPKEYFTNPWDLFDFMVTVCSLAGVLGETVNDSFYYVIILRPLRLLRLFKVKKRYRDVLGTLFMLINRLSGLIVVIMLVYYFFAIVAMEMFHNEDLTNCCVNTSVEANYVKTNTSQGYYYLNNFNNIFFAGVTLFELTVINNWFIIMDGYAFHVSEWTRIYFMIFYIVMMVVMTIVVAFVLELFLFRIAYRRTMHLEDIDDHLKLTVDIELSSEEREMCENSDMILNSNHIISQGNSRDIRTSVVFRGERTRSKEDFSMRMYKDEVKGWIEEDDAERARTIEDLDKMRRHSRRSTNNSINLAV